MSRRVPAHPGLEPAQARADVAEGAGDHVVHPTGHVLDPPARVDGDVGRGVPGDRLDLLGEGVQALGQPQQHHLGPAQQLAVQAPQRVVAGEGVGEAEAFGVDLEGAFSGDPVLVDDDVGRVARPGGAGHRTQGERPEGVVEHDDAAGAAAVGGRVAAQVLVGLGEQQAVHPVDGGQLGPFGPGEPAEGVEAVEERVELLR